MPSAAEWAKILELTPKPIVEAAEPVDQAGDPFRCKRCRGRIMREWDTVTHCYEETCLNCGYIKPPEQVLDLPGPAKGQRSPSSGGIMI
jgi:hypothetical protein